MVTINELKDKFKTGMKPTQKDFEDLIEYCYNNEINVDQLLTQNDDLKKLVSKQKFDYDKVILNARVNAGTQNGVVAMGISGFHTSQSIKIDDGVEKIIFAKNYKQGIVNLNNIAFYDSNSNYLSGYNMSSFSNSFNENNMLEIVPPSNAKEFIFSVQGVYQRIGVFFNEYSNNFNYYNFIDKEYNLKSSWIGKKIVGFGDSLIGEASNSNTSLIGVLAKEFHFEPINRGIGGSTVLQSDTESIAWLSDGTNKSLGPHGEYASRPNSLNDGSGSNTSSEQPNNTFEIKTSMCNDERVDTIPTDADAIIILAGANGMDESSYRLMLQKIITRCPSAIIFCCSLTHFYSDDARNNIVNVIERNNVINKLCEEFNCVFIDLKRGMGINHINKHLYLSDKIHFNALGIQKLSLSVAAKLRSYSPLSIK